MDVFIESFPIIGKGIGLTFQVLIGGLLVGTSIAIPCSILRYKGIGLFIMVPLISLIRGTPLMLQLSVVYFALPGLTGVRLGVLGSAIITFGFNSFAYISEILRAGIESIPKGQFEAARTLHIPIYNTWKDIIFPQVLKNIFPAMVNEFTTFLKETSLVSVLGGMDIMRSATTFAAQKFMYFTPLCVAAIYYYSMILLVEYVARKVERSMKY